MQSKRIYSSIFYFKLESSIISISLFEINYKSCLSEVYGFWRKKPNHFETDRNERWKKNMHDNKTNYFSFQLTKAFNLVSMIQ